ncbi:hypothetical protein CHS0354_008856 [Potamilus streckersoni]|uniref:Uncharacterized protein n=1 Tax=Potamilus streckersoni TaxID=2493646 RepID=A0AAE0SM75_9BIVA|nr:hypothetical protein CHS0354_008856 [Potamilus streckersoni]
MQNIKAGNKKCTTFYAIGATPQATTNKSPAEMLFGRKMKTKLPSIQIKSDDNKTRKIDTDTNFKVGDSVLLSTKDINDNSEKIRPSDNEEFSIPQESKEFNPYSTI